MPSKTRQRRRVEPANKTGLNITAEDEIAFITYMANAAHNYGRQVQRRTSARGSALSISL